MSLDDIYKVNVKNWVEHPLSEITQLLSMEDESPDAKATPIRAWHMEQQRGLIINHASLLEELFLGRDVSYKISPWGSVINWGDNHLTLSPATQRCRKLTKAQRAMHQHGADLFFERWYDWVHNELKSVLQEKENLVQDDKANKTEVHSYHLYAALRKASLRVIARTVCATFVGDVIEEIASSLEELDTAAARLLYCGKGSRPTWFPGSENKRTQKGIKNLDALIRPLIRQRLAGADEDDLLSRWVNTQGDDGKHLNEDQIISEAFCFLIMSYTSLPKLIFSAAYEISQEGQEVICERLQKEHDGIIEILTPPPGGFPIGTPPPRAPNNTSANRTLPLHTMVSLETMRLYPPSWCLTYLIKESSEFKGIPFEKDQHFWVSPWALHRNQRRFKTADRFWPQRWAGNLESQLPKSAFIPFGIEEKPSLSETFCKELVPRFLMVWFAHFEMIDASQPIQWELSLCLRPSNLIDWKSK